MVNFSIFNVTIGAQVEGRESGDWFVCPVVAAQDSDRHGTTVAFTSIFEVPVYTQPRRGARTYVDG